MGVATWLKACFADGVPRRSAIVAIIVGPILTAINQGDSVLAGQPIDLPKLVLTFLVPYAVATVGAVGAGKMGIQPASGPETREKPCQPAMVKLSSGNSAASGFGVTSLKARVHVTLKSGVLDPQGKAIEVALSGLGFEGVGDVRQGKVIEFTLAEEDPDKARESVEAMCRQLLANTVIENYTIELET